MFRLLDTPIWCLYELIIKETIKICSDGSTPGMWLGSTYLDQGVLFFSGMSGLGFLNYLKIFGFWLCFPTDVLSTIRIAYIMAGLCLKAVYHFACVSSNVVIRQQISSQCFETQQYIYTFQSETVSMHDRQHFLASMNKYQMNLTHLRISIKKKNIFLEIYKFF